MKANIEIIAYKNNKRIVTYYTVDLYYGIANDYYDKYKKLGYKNISVRII